jgi:hypothetical protein
MGSASMSEQRTPDELTAENDLICTKLLGLTKHCSAPSCPDWRTADGKRFWSNPTFDNWADAGLILNALAATAVYFEHGYDDNDNEWFCEIRPHWSIWATTGPLAIRAAALEYIRSLP